jgi:hypothetical protein
MPPKGRARAKRTTANTTTTDQGGEREAAAVVAHGLRMQKLDGEGAPVGEPVHLDDATVSLQPAEPFNAEPRQLFSTTAAMMEFSTDDPVAVAVVRELTRIPIPTAVVAEWFPSYFRPPGEDQPWAVCKAFLTPQGLYVYRAAPVESETFTTGATPAWYSPVDFAKTAKPVTGYAAMNAGIPIETAAGRVNVQPYPGCGCGHRKLKNWTPSWSRNRISWTDAVALVDPTAGR